MLLEATTIIAVKKGNECAIGGDGQVTMGQSVIMKHTARKVRRIYDGRVLIGFAGSVADAFALSEKFEDKLRQFSGNLPRAAVELASEWRQDKAMRQLEAMLIALDKDNLLIVSGTGEVIEPDDGIAAIGSGGNYAFAAAKALKGNTDMSAKEIVQKSMEIAASICVFTNDNIYVDEI
ncbi:MAG: ATP-dependent protease subunit HslV [Clostridiales bacterium]|nr:ATP-dependent protease subunit HslV [Clostridiales bacterium]